MTCVARKDLVYYLLWHDADELLFAIHKHLLIADVNRGTTEFG